MIHLFVGSHVKKPESGLFSDWIGNNTNDLCRSDWPKSRHPLVVVNFSLHFCLHNEQWIHTRVRYEIFAGSEISSIEIFSISSYTNLIPATSYRSNKRVHFSNNQFMNGILTWFDCNSSFKNLWIILSDLHFLNTFQFMKYGASALFFFSLLSVQNEVNEL